MVPPAAEEEVQASIVVTPLAEDDHEVVVEQEEDDDLDSRGLVTGENAPQNYPHHTIDVGNAWAQANYYFARQWRRVPSSWTLERDPSIAFRHVLTLFGFLSLCIFVFSVPSILFVVSPLAPKPPGTGPDLDEAASTISGKNGAVAADVPLCSEAGVNVMNEFDGNAIDAMVTTMLCQGVLAPFASGLGGGAHILIHFKRTPDSIGVSRFYDAREVAPAAATMSMFSKNVTLARFGGLSVAVPGELRGLFKAHSDFGRLSWSQVVDPVVEIAQTAKVGKFLAIKLIQMNDTIYSSPSLFTLFTKQVLTKSGQDHQNAAASVELPGGRQFMPNVRLAEPFLSEREGISSPGDGEGVQDANNKDEHGVTPPENLSTTNTTYTAKLLEEGDEMINEKLISTLQAISKYGASALYSNMSEALAKEVRDAGGVMTAKDMREYEVKMRDVLHSSYQGFTILGTSIPSSGGVSVAMALNMVMELQFRKKGRNTLSYHMLTECFKYVFGAAMGLGDPDYVPTARAQMQRMMSRREAMRRAYRINQKRTFPPEQYSSRISTSSLEDGTSHVSIMDKNGSAVSVTSTINLPFGAGLISSSTGILLNDQMDGFTTSITRLNAYGLYPTSENKVQGGKRAVTSMCPTMVMRGKKVYLVVGGSGGPKAVTGVLQTLLNVLDFGDAIADAINAPRIHHQLVPNRLSLEAANTSTCEEMHILHRSEGQSKSGVTGGWAYWSSVCQGLKDIGHQLEGPAVHGAVQAVLSPDALSGESGGKMFASSDARRIGKAAAY